MYPAPPVTKTVLEGGEGDASATVQVTDQINVKIRSIIFMVMDVMFCVSFVRAIRLDAVRHEHVFELGQQRPTVTMGISSKLLLVHWQKTHQQTGNIQSKPVSNFVL